MKYITQAELAHHRREILRRYWRVKQDKDLEIAALQAENKNLRNALLEIHGDKYEPYSHRTIREIAIDALEGK